MKQKERIPAVSARRTSYTGETLFENTTIHQTSYITQNLEIYLEQREYKLITDIGGAGGPSSFFFFSTGTLQHVPALTMFRNDDHTTRKQVLEHMKPTPLLLLIVHRADERHYQIRDNKNRNTQTPFQWRIMKISRFPHLIQILSSKIK